MFRNKIVVVLLTLFTIAVSWFHMAFEVDASLEWWNVLVSAAFMAVWLLCILLCRKSAHFQIYSICYWLFVFVSSALWAVTDTPGSLLAFPMLFGPAGLYGFSNWATSQNLLVLPTCAIAGCYLALSISLLVRHRRQKKKSQAA